METRRKESCLSDLDRRERIEWLTDMAVTDVEQKRLIKANGIKVCKRTKKPR